VLVGVIAVVGLVGSVTGVWAKRTLFDSERFASKMDPVVRDPVVTGAVAAYVTGQVFTLVDVESLVSSVAPPALAPLVPTFVAGAQSAVEGRVNDALATDQGAAILQELVVRAHRTAMGLLQGDGLSDGLSLSDDTVSLNLLPVISTGVRGVQGLGLFTGVTVPEFSADGDPAAQIAELEALTGRDLPDDFGQLVVFRGDAVAEASAYVEVAQQALVVAKRALIAMIILTVAAYVGAVLLARHRRRAVLILLVASMGALLVVRAIVNKVVEDLPELVTEPGARAALDGAVDSFTKGYFRAGAAVTLLALIGLVVLLVTGPSGAAAKVRGGAGGAKASLSRTVLGHPEAAAATLAAAGVAVLFLAGVGWFTLLLALACFAGAGWLVTRANAAGAEAETAGD
jgi:hypothetical protein